jgi:hypothetical protein
LPIDRPLTESLDRDYGQSEADSYFLPFTIVFLIVDDRAYRRVLNTVFLENLLHVCDWMHSTPLNKVCMYALAAINEFEEADQLFEEECQEFGSDWPTYPGSWGAVFLQVAIRTAEEVPEPEGIGALLSIVEHRLRTTDGLPDASLRTLFKLFDEHADFTSQVALFKTVHFLIGRGRHPRLAIHLLTSYDILQRIAAENQSVSELVQLFGWVRDQIASFKTIQEEFTRDSLVQLISDPANCIPVFEVNEAPAHVVFNIRDFVRDIAWTFFQAYFKATVKLDFRPLVGQ